MVDIADPAYKRIVTLLFREWTKADVVVNMAYSLRPELAVGPAMELRTAGAALRDCMMALAGEGPRTPIDDIAFNLLEGALGVCRRARRNAVDAIILFLNESLDKALDDFGTDRMLRLNPQIPLLQTDLQKCRDLLEGARRRPDHELVRDYEWLESRLPELVDRSQQLGFPRRTRFRERYSQFIWSLTVLLAAITAPILVFALKYSPSDGLRGLPIYAQVALVLGATVATAIIALLSRASRND